MNQATLNLLTQAQQSVKSGRKQEAYQLLLQAAQQDPGEFRLWLGLAGLAESPELSLKFVAQAEKLQPLDPKVLQAKSWAEERLRAAHAQKAEAPTQSFLAPRPTVASKPVIAPQPAPVPQGQPARVVPLVAPVRPLPSATPEAVSAAVTPLPARGRGRMVLFAAALLSLVILIFLAFTLSNPGSNNNTEQPIAAADLTATPTLTPPAPADPAQTSTSPEENAPETQSTPVLIQPKNIVSQNQQPRTTWTATPIPTNTPTPTQTPNPTQC